MDVLCTWSAQEAFWLGALFVPLPTPAQFPTAVSISCQGQNEQRRDALKKTGKKRKGRKQDTVWEMLELNKYRILPLNTAAHPLLPPLLSFPFSPFTISKQTRSLHTWHAFKNAISGTSRKHSLSHRHSNKTRTLREQSCHLTHSHMS